MSLGTGYWRVIRGHLFVSIFQECAESLASENASRLAAMRGAGIVDLRGLAAALNARGIRTARGGRWHVSNVKNVIDRSQRQRLL